MTIQAAPERLVIAVQTRTELDAALDRALDRLKPVALARLSAELPPGTTRESWGPVLQ